MPLVRKLKWGILLGLDIALLYLALWITLKLRYGQTFDQSVWDQHLFPFSILFFGWLLIFYIFGLYDLRLAKNNASFYASLGKSLATAFGTAIVFFYLTPFFGIAPKTNLLLVAVLVFLLLSLWRQLYNLFIKYPLAPDDILIIGQDAQVLELRKHLEKNPQLGYRIFGIIEPKPDALKQLLLGTPKIHRIVSAFPIHSHMEFVKFLFGYADQFAFEHFSSLYERITDKVPLSQIDEVWFLNNLKERERNLYETGKRILDITAGLFLALFTLLLLPIIALAIKLDSPGPLLYKQKRVGKNGKMFNLLKFRSMAENAEEAGALWAQKNDPRITRAGQSVQKNVSRRITPVHPYPSRGDELYWPAARAAGVRRAACERNTLLPHSPHCQARSHGLGSSQCALWELKPRSFGETSVRTLLH